MDPVLAQQIYEEGCFLLLLGMPPGTEFGIDMNSWNVGDKFKGIKMIPPGLHFIYYSAVSRQGDLAPRTGFFHVFQKKEVLVRHYDPLTEDLKPQEEEDLNLLDRLRGNLKHLDSSLGCYPLDSWRKWVSLTQHITPQDLKRMQPVSEKICSAPELITVPTEKDLLDMPPLEDSSSVVPPCEDTTSKALKCSPTGDLPNMITRPGTELRFTKFPEARYREGATPSEITRDSLDSSFCLLQMIADLERPEVLLSELQFSFVCFLVGQVWEGWENWRKLISALCRAEKLLLECPQVYLQIVSALYYQIQEVPEDLFVDIVERNNFLAHVLATLFANINDNVPCLPSILVSRANKFKAHLISKFNWDLSIEDSGDDAPVFVELEGYEISNAAVN